MEALEVVKHTRSELLGSTSHIPVAQPRARPESFVGMDCPARPVIEPSHSSARAAYAPQLLRCCTVLYMTYPMHTLPPSLVLLLVYRTTHPRRALVAKLVA